MLTRTIELSGGGWLLDRPEFLDRAEADALFSWMLEQIPWQQGHVRLFGRSIPEPRLTAWFSDCDYTYSGRTLPRAELPALLAALRDRVAEVAGTPLDSVLLNRYRDGNDSVGFHADDEPELGENPCVASLSLGATRRFVLAPKRQRSAPRVELRLGHGELLVMGGSCQHHYRHALPKQPSVAGERINLTFRRMLR